MPPAAEGNTKTVPEGVYFPFAVEWRITEACNMNCSYCVSHRGSIPEDIDLKETAERIAGLSPKHLWIGGGEPTLVKELPEILRMLKEVSDPHIGLNTNATDLEALFLLIPYLDDIIVSLDTLSRPLSLKTRGVLPEDTLRTLESAARYAKNSGYKVNFSVNSVIYRDSLKSPGLKELNSAISDMNLNISHILCPLYPASEEESIVSDNRMKEKLHKIVDDIRSSGGRVHIDFPEFEECVKILPVKCLRRYFRVQIVSDGDFFSPCPPADPASPWCLFPCNAACFMEDILLNPTAENINGSPLMGRLSRKEKKSLENFIIKYSPSELSDGVLNPLVKGNL